MKTKMRTVKVSDYDLRGKKTTKIMKLKVVVPALNGWAVRIGLNHVEFWKYDPAVLNKAQRKKLNVVAWRSINIPVNINA